MFRILVLHYSQSGQLDKIARSVLAPLEAQDGVEVSWQNLQPKQAYPFPWPFWQFFDTFPECVYLDPAPIKPLTIDTDKEFDLIIIAYQVWFLSPSLPIVAFLQSADAKKLLANKPVVTLVGCRNMWLSAQDKMRVMLTRLGAQLVDNVVLQDQGPPWATFITTPRWVLTGKKNGFWGIFPPAGISEHEIISAKRFGQALTLALPLLQSGHLGPFLTGLGAVKVNPGYIAGERLAHRSFKMWGRLLRFMGSAGSPGRRVVLVFYVIFLVTLILTVIPLGIVLRALIRPFMRSKLGEQVRQLEAPSGSSTERLGTI
ncbi:MAG: dialkylresorcinol condensing enzyme [Acidiferrobacterales bacterium]